MRVQLIVLLFLLGSVLAQTQSVRAPGDDAEPCYDHGAVQLAGVMNIREEPTTSSQKVDVGERGDAFYVKDTTQGDAYCWLQIKPGWMAVTGSVKPLGDPSVVGSLEYRRDIRRALRLLADEAPNPYLNVAAHVDTIADGAPPGKTTNWRGLPQAFVKHDHLYIPAGFNPMWLSGEEMDLFTAGLIVHEACHLQQYDEGSMCGATMTEIETECWRAQAAAMSKIDRLSHVTRTIRNSIKNVAETYGTERYKC